MTSRTLQFLVCLIMVTESKTFESLTHYVNTTVSVEIQSPTAAHVTPVPHSDHLVCYSCKFISNVMNCRHAKRCPKGSSCLRGQLTSGLYYNDCVPAPACMILPAQLQTTGTVTFLSHHFKHFQCCSQSKCNNNLNPVFGR